MRRREVFALWLAGVRSLPRIAEQVGVSHVTVWKDVQAELAEVNRTLTDNVLRARALGVARCEAIILEQWTRMQDKASPAVASEAARVILKAMAEEHKLTGAYAPAKVALTDPTGDEPFRSLSDEALDKKIAELQAAITGTDLTKLAVIDVKPVAGGGNGSKGNWSRRDGEPKKGGGDAV